MTTPANNHPWRNAARIGEMDARAREEYAMSGRAKERRAVPDAANPLIRGGSTGSRRRGGGDE